MFSQSLSMVMGIFVQMTSNLLNVSGYIQDFSILTDKSSKVYLELVTNDTDINQLYKLTEFSFQNGEIWKMYSVP